MTPAHNAPFPPRVTPAARQVRTYKVYMVGGLRAGAPLGLVAPSPGPALDTPPPPHQVCRLLAGDQHHTHAPKEQPHPLPKLLRRFGEELQGAGQQCYSLIARGPRRIACMDSNATA